MKNSLLSLYQSILVPIFSDWIWDDDLSCLDMAVTNRKQREYFVVILSTSYIVNTEFSRENRDEFYEWLLLRSISLKKLRFVEGLPSILEVKLIARANHLSCLECLATLETVEVLTGLNLFVDTLLISSCPYAENLQALLESLPNLNHLDLINCGPILDTIYAMLPIWAPHLKRLSAPFVHRPDCLLSLKDISVEYSCGELFDNSRSTNRYYCSVKSSETVDATTTCISGTFYKMTSLDIREDITASDGPLLLPLIPCVEDLSIIYYDLGVVDVLKIFTANFLQLTILRVSESNIDEGDWITIFKCSKLLRFVDIKDCLVTEKAGLAIAKYSSFLEECKLMRCIVSDSIILAILSECPNLTSLRFSMSLPEEAVLPFIINKESLVLTSTAQFSHFLRNYKNRLNQLSYHSNIWITNLDVVLNQNPGLRCIELDLYSMCPSVFASLARCCPLLRSVSVVSHCKRDAGCLLPLADCNNLTSLVVLDFDHLTDEIICRIVEGKTSFRQLDISTSSGYTGNIVTFVARTCPQLRYFGISSDSVKCSHIIDLLDRCKNLHSLDLERCTSLILPILSLKNRRMYYLNVQGCNISKASMKEFLETSNFQCRTVEYGNVTKSVDKWD